MTYIIDILVSATTGLGVSWLFRSWITERLKQSISYEYSEKLESYKTELNSKLIAAQHNNQISQIRTSLFFDHQREAFSKIISLIAKANEAWIDDSYVEYQGPQEPVPHNSYKELKDYFIQKQLFLDEDCVAAIELILEYYGDSFPFDDGIELHQRDCSTAYDNVESLLPLVASLFRQKIGISDNSAPEKTIAQIGTIRLINSMSFFDADIPPKGALRVNPNNQIEKSLKIYRDNQEELKKYLEYFSDHLRKQDSFQEHYRKAERYLKILS